MSWHNLYIIWLSNINLAYDLQISSFCLNAAAIIGNRL